MGATNKYYRSTLYEPDYFAMMRDGFTPIYEISDAGPSNKVVGKEGSAMGYAGAIGVGVSIGKGIGDAVGGYMTARATASALLAQSGVTENNALVAQMGVEQAFRAGEAQLAAIGFKQAETKARQRVAYAANGIAIGVGSSAEVMASTDLQAEADKAQARINALAQAWGYRRQRMMAFATARGQELMARASEKAGRVSMAASLISTALSAYAGFASGGVTNAGGK